MSDIGFISEMQHFSTGDGEGIRTTIFMQGCNLNCEWCHNPETIPKDGSILLYDALCSNCGKCKVVCLKEAHVFIDGKHQIDRNACVLCGKCEQICPNSAIKISGKQMSIAQVMKYILEDAEFYAESGGGVTISGGEPLLQIDFCMMLAKECQKCGIDVIIDTAGNVPFEYLQKIIPFTKTFFFDLKANCEVDYKEKTGGSFELALDNLKKLAKAGCDVIVRIPIIPNHNDTSQYLEKCADVLDKVGITKVQILPFHRLGTSKYKALSKKYTYAETKPLSKEKAKELLKVFEKHGFICKIDG